MKPAVLFLLAAAACFKHGMAAEPPAAGELNPWQAAAMRAAAAEHPAAAPDFSSPDPVVRCLAAAAWLERLKSEHASLKGGAREHSAAETDAAALLCADADWRVRCEGARICGLLAAPELVPALAPLLRDEAWPARRRAIEALGVMPPGENIAELSALLDMRGAAWRIERHSALKALGALTHTPSLARALSDPAPEIRTEAAWQIERLPLWPPETRSALQEARASEKDAEVRAVMEKVWSAQRPAPGPGDVLSPHPDYAPEHR